MQIRPVGPAAAALSACTGRGFFLTLWLIPYSNRVCLLHELKRSWSDVAAGVRPPPTRGLEQHPVSLWPVYQHNTARRDKQQQLLQSGIGVFGGLDYQRCYEAFSLPLCVLRCYGRWHPAAALITMAENQWLHCGGGFGQRPASRTQAMMYYSCGTIRI